MTILYNDKKISIQFEIYHGNSGYVIFIDDKLASEKYFNTKEEAIASAKEIIDASSKV